MHIRSPGASNWDSSLKEVMLGRAEEMKCPKGEGEGEGEVEEREEVKVKARQQKEQHQWKERMISHAQQMRSKRRRILRSLWR